MLLALEPETPSSDLEVTIAQNEHHISIERIILSERPIGLLLPVEHALARLETIRASDLAGWEIVVPNRFHGVALSEQVRFALDSVGAQTVRPPEGNAIGVERYGTLKRLPAITLNWFAPSEDQKGMQVRTVNELGRTALALIRLTGEQRPSAACFWDYAAAIDLSSPLHLTS